MSYEEWTRLLIEDLGPLSKAEITFKPITVIVGKNCYGKSLLVGLSYLLASTLPDFKHLMKLVGDEGFSLAEEGYRAARAEDTQRLEQCLAKLLHLFFEKLGPPLASPLTQRFKEFFNVDRVNGLFKGKALLSGAHLSCRIEPTEEFKVTFQGYDALRPRLINMERPRLDEIHMNVRLMDSDLTGVLSESFDLLKFIGGEMVPLALADLTPLSFGVGESLLFTDSRAGILRLISVALTSSLEYGGRMVPLKERLFESAYIKAALNFRERGVIEVVKAPFNNLLAELGVRDVKVERVAGRPMVKVEDKWGNELPLEETPSGIRESLLIVLALASKPRLFTSMFIEEIEAHLHPSALRGLTELLCNSILAEEGPYYVVLTVHNPIVLSCLNNAILKREGLSELISAVHLREVDGRVVTESISITPEGFDESCLSQVFVDLLEERAELRDTKANKTQH